MTVSHGFVNIQARGTLALPVTLRRSLHLDQPGAQVEVVERDDGVIELQPHLPVAARDAWAGYESRTAADSTDGPPAASAAAGPVAPKSKKPKRAK